MANSDRLRKSREGKMFIPMNIDGGGGEDSFFNATKLGVIVALVIVTIFVFSSLASSKADAKGYIIAIATMIFLYQLVIRYIIIEERYYYKVYKETKQYKNPTAAVFWNIASFRDTDEGTLIIYSDMKIGVLVRLERDTIIGKNKDFTEQHFDAVSEFFKELHLKDLSYVQLNLMEQAGKDDRIEHLDRLISNVENANIAKVLELQLGYIKNITRETLYETDYVLVYTNKLSEGDYLISSTTECLFKLMDGAYNKFEILHSRDIKELTKELYHVNYFDYAEATANLFKQSGMTIPKAFDIEEVKFNTGESKSIGEREKILIRNLTSGVEDGTLKMDGWTIKDALDGKLNINFVGARGEIDKSSSDIEDINEEDVKNTEGNIIIDLDNEAFGGEYGIGINTVKADEEIIEPELKQVKRRRILGKKDK